MQEAQRMTKTALYKNLDRGNTEEFLERVLSRYEGEIALVSSFGTESGVLLHLVATIDPTIPVLFLNTGKLFGETLRYRDTLQMRFGLTEVRTIMPHPRNVEEFDERGILFSRDPERCCSMRKVWPLQEALKPFSAWINGRKHFQTSERTALQRLEISDNFVKINPLAGWSARRIKKYQEEHQIPEHPLLKDGFHSIGCMPCTDPVSQGEDSRAGRWRNLSKTECGIHHMAAAIRLDEKIAGPDKSSETLPEPSLFRGADKLDMS